MNKEDFLHILKKHREGSATEDEEAFLLAYYALLDQGEELTDQKDPEEVRLLKESIKSEIDLRTGAFPEMQIGNSKRGILYRQAVWLAAATVLIVSVFYFSKNTEPAPVAAITRKATAPDSRIVPGSNQAILTLGNGDVVKLDDQQAGPIRQEDGVAVRKAENGHLVYDAGKAVQALMHTVSTPRGGQYQLTLSDGTHVWLNAATSIKFPAVFGDTTRIVELSGEAYFEVAHDAGRPFEVRSAGQLIRVLGTRFNVTAYTDEPAIRTTLIEGKVNVLKTNSESGERLREGRILKPGQQATLTGDRLRVTNIDPETSVAWKNGYFRFDQADIRSVMRQISRWYDVGVEYRGNDGADLFTGEIKRDEDIGNVLRIMQLNNVDVRVTGRKIIVTH